MNTKLIFHLPQGHLHIEVKAQKEEKEERESVELYLVFSQYGRHSGLNPATPNDTFLFCCSCN